MIYEIIKSKNYMFLPVVHKYAAFCFMRANYPFWGRNKNHRKSTEVKCVLRF